MSGNRLESTPSYARIAESGREGHPGVKTTRLPREVTRLDTGGRVEAEAGVAIMRGRPVNQS